MIAHTYSIGFPVERCPFWIREASYISTPEAAALTYDEKVVWNKRVDLYETNNLNASAVQNLLI